MDTPILGDKSQFPADEIVFSHIGKAKPLWVALFKYLDDEHPDFTRQWRYYNDGKSWLMKVQHKKKTVFWLSLVPGTFRTGFYIHEKAEKIVKDSALSDELKEQFRAKGFGKLRGITVVFKNRKDIEFAKELIGIKLNL
ncbi:MAG TPA: DUF3788 family protein [Terriglobia bacterium]|nr:DUF3788 family protein [Terriglobia bacterium]